MNIHHDHQTTKERIAEEQQLAITLTNQQGRIYNKDKYGLYPKQLFRLDYYYYYYYY